MSQDFQVRGVEIPQFAKNQAIERFAYRRSHPLEIVVKGYDGERFCTVTADTDMSSLRAGAPMFTWCEHCGWPVELKDEQWNLKIPAKCCGECEVLIHAGFMDEAKSK